MENLETILDEIERFEKMSESEKFPPVLDEYLKFVAKTGDPLFPWYKIKKLLRQKLSVVMNEFFDTLGVEEKMDIANIPSRYKILQQFDSFTGAPFTIQRICEILVDPGRHYKRTDKFLRGLEKNILVVSYVEPGHTKRVLEQQQQNLMNGIEDTSLHIDSSLNNEPKVSAVLQSLEPDLNLEDGAGSEEPMNGTVTTNGLTEDSSSSSSSSSSSTSSSPTPDDENQELGPSPKRPRLDLQPQSEQREAHQSIECDKEAVPTTPEEEEEQEATHSLIKGEEETGSDASVSCDQDKRNAKTSHELQPLEDKETSDLPSEVHSEAAPVCSSFKEGSEVTKDLFLTLETNSESQNEVKVEDSYLSEVHSSNSEEQNVWSEDKTICSETKTNSNGGSPDSAQDSSQNSILASEDSLQEESSSSNIDSEAVAALRDSTKEDEEAEAAASETSTPGDSSQTPTPTPEDVSEADSTSSISSKSQNQDDSTSTLIKDVHETGMTEESDSSCSSSNP